MEEIRNTKYEISNRLSNHGATENTEIINKDVQDKKAYPAESCTSFLNNPKNICVHPRSSAVLSSEITVGVLAVQGDFVKHIEMIEQCGVKALPVRSVDEIDVVQGLIIPGGESTTVGKLMARYGLDVKIRERASEGMPIFGTCTGMILLAKDIVGSDQHRLGLIDFTVLRNAFGRQVDSFEADLDISVIGPPTVRAVFIRAPYAVEVGDGVEVIAQVDDKIILLKQGNLLASAFHPELTDDNRVHAYFVGLIREWLVAKG